MMNLVVMNEIFHKIASRVSLIIGSPAAFVVAVAIIIIWAVSGPTFGFSDTWQLFINTGTTIVTFLIVILIQNTQNRDAKAIHLKLDELLKGVKGARTGFANIEELSDEELNGLNEQFEKLRTHYAKELERRGRPKPASQE